MNGWITGVTCGIAAAIAAGRLGAGLLLDRRVSEEDDLMAVADAVAEPDDEAPTELTNADCDSLWDTYEDDFEAQMTEAA